MTHKEDRVLEYVLRQMRHMEKNIMAKIDDFIAATGAFFDRMDTAVANIQADIDGLDKEIADLKASQGTLTPEQQAAFDALQARASGLADKVDALDALTPPVAPPATA